MADVISLLVSIILTSVLKCIWQTFFICSIESPQCNDKCSKKKFFDSDFPSPCFDVPKASNFTSGRVQNRDTKNRRLGTIVTSIQDSKPREKQISQSFSYCGRKNVFAVLISTLGRFYRAKKKSVIYTLINDSHRSYLEGFTKLYSYVRLEVFKGRVP